MYAITSRAAGGWHEEVLIHLDKDGTPRGSVFTFRHAVAAEQHCTARQEVSPGITGIIGRHRRGG